MSHEIKKIVGSLEELLESLKAKPVIVEAPISEDDAFIVEETFAEELLSTIFKNIPENTSPADIAECFLRISEIKAKELGLSKARLAEAALEFCLEISEELNNKLTEEILGED